MRTFQRLPAGFPAPAQNPDEPPLQPWDWDVEEWGDEDIYRDRDPNKERKNVRDSNRDD